MKVPFWNSIAFAHCSQWISMPFVQFNNILLPLFFNRKQVEIGKSTYIHVSTLPNATHITISRDTHAAIQYVFSDAGPSETGVFQSSNTTPSYSLWERLLKTFALVTLYNPSLQDLMFGDPKDLTTAFTNFLPSTNTAEHKHPHMHTHTPYTLFTHIATPLAPCLSANVRHGQTLLRSKIIYISRHAPYRLHVGFGMVPTHNVWLVRSEGMAIRNKNDPFFIEVYRISYEIQIYIYFTHSIRVLLLKGYLGWESRINEYYTKCFLASGNWPALCVCVGMKMCVFVCAVLFWIWPKCGHGRIGFGWFFACSDGWEWLGELTYGVGMKVRKCVE